jgi:CheY-like chemotaxis protein
VRNEAIILLAEDREDDIILTRAGFRKACVSNPLYVVRDGEEAIEYLKGEGKFSNREEFPLPDLLLLDLKMPRKDGFEVLKWVRDAGMEKLRVIVFSSSERSADVSLAYQLGANSFLVKPVEFERFIEMIKMICQYWLTLDKWPEVSRKTEAQKADTDSRAGRG